MILHVKATFTNALNTKENVYRTLEPEIEARKMLQFWNQTTALYQASAIQRVSNVNEEIEQVTKAKDY